MTKSEAILYSLAVYCLLMLAIGAWASRRTHDAGDFFLGGRRMGAWITALAQGSTQSSAWTLVGVSGAAFSWGLSAAWLWVAVMAGYVVNWYWVAPRLRRLSLASGSVTLVQELAGDPAGARHLAVLRSCSLIILVSFLFYVAAQFQAAGQAFAAGLDLPVAACIAIGAAVTVAYTFMGGFWAASATDVVQALLMLGVALFLPAVAFMVAGGVDGIVQGLAVEGDSVVSLTGGRTGLASLAFVLGTMGIGLGAPGQPHVVNRFMAARDDGVIRRGAVIALVWIALVLAGMLVLGWSGRVLYAGMGQPENVIYVVADRLLPPIVAGLVAVAVMSAIMSTVDSQLLTATSSLTIDRGGRAGGQVTVWSSRLALAGFSIAAVLVAIFAPESIYTRVLFAWNAIGAAFGPLVLLLVSGRRVGQAGTLACLWTGFLLTVVFYLLPDSPGDLHERILPFFVALGAALWVDRRKA
ncbi:MAG: sodium/proline symporter [Steroidobacteraceae bacterium]|nr:sodium/proline symporter [Steroidobacteraceae bacterium]